MEDIVNNTIGPFSNVTVEPNVTFHCNGTCLTMPQSTTLEESVWSNISIDYMNMVLISLNHNFTWNGNFTAVNLSRQRQTTSHDDIIFPVLCNQKYSLQPTSDNARGSLFFNCLSNIRHQCTINTTLQKHDGYSLFW
jgi:hypothetical protein